MAMPFITEFYPELEKHYIKRLSNGLRYRLKGYNCDDQGQIAYYVLEDGTKLDPLDTDWKSYTVERPMKYPDGNPKTAFGIKKPPTWYISPYAMYQWGLAALHGALKYGHFNWRKDPVSVSTYINAAQRHLDLFKEGEQCASDSHVHHLAHVMACCAIIIDAERFGTLIDDRNLKHMDLEKAFEEMAEVAEFLHNRWGKTLEGPIDMMATETEDKDKEKNG